mmetsp:Transcript_3238/g.2706  ORF Transcript_3238/g.2706 Transcript_3238/m.2706 type:complete len:91 (+) Transcript_3238:271-543(+)
MIDDMTSSEEQSSTRNSKRTEICQTLEPPKPKKKQYKLKPPKRFFKEDLERTPLRMIDRNKKSYYRTKTSVNKDKTNAYSNNIQKQKSNK